jgi:hypothetical protein
MPEEIVAFPDQPLVQASKVSPLHDLVLLLIYIFQPEAYTVASECAMPLDTKIPTWFPTVGKNVLN